MIAHVQSDPSAAKRLAALSGRSERLRERMWAGQDRP